MVDVPGGYGTSEFTKEAGEMVRRKSTSPPVVPSEEPAWTPLDLAIVPTSARLELPMAGVTRAELRRIGELVAQLGKLMVDLSHRHNMTERSIMFEAANSVRATQYAIGPMRRAKRKVVHQGLDRE